MNTVDTLALEMQLVAYCGINKSSKQADVLSRSHDTAMDNNSWRCPRFLSFELQLYKVGSTFKPDLFYKV